MGVFNKGTVDPTWKPDVGHIDPEWMSWARKEIGQKEIPGSGENPRIKFYHSHANNKYKTEAISWCSSFVCAALEECGYASTDSEWAQSYTNFGDKLVKPKHGCIVVFKWSAEHGHVGFYDENSKGVLPILGGNQSDAVCIKDFGSSLGSVVGYRWASKKK